MEKNVVLAIVLSALILFGGTYLMSSIEKKNAREAPAIAPEQLEIVEDESSDTVIETTSEAESVEKSDVELREQDYPVETIVEKTDLFEIHFNTAGAVVTELYLLREMDEDEPISMVLDGESDVGTFNMAFGAYDAAYITDIFKHERIQRGREIIHLFSRDFIQNGQIFTVSRSYRIIPGEYMIEHQIILKTPDGKFVPLLDGDQPAYTLTYGPQIGPKFAKIDGRYEIRNNISWGPDPKSGKFKRELYKKKGDDNLIQIGDTVSWAAISGKYFAVIADPGSGSSTITWNENPVKGQSQASRLQISKPARRQSLIEDTYRYYVGPLDKANLNRYNKAEDNAFGVSGMAFQNAPRTSAVLGWLESILRWLLEIFYRIVPNYGLSIIFLTILIKIILFPFTHKSYKSTSKMQAAQPKIKAIQEQFKGDKQKIQQKTAELYKQEGINPLGGCLPLLFQLPILFALFNLLNRYFPLRGAEFIPGWITDLSAPEYIVEFANPINLRIWTLEAIRILPVLYLGGQLLTTKITQRASAGAQSGAQQKILTVGMPIMFFFILYNMPSGLLLYWTVMNFITVGQQLITNYFKKRKAAGGVV